jgi:hypothetical protein
MTLHTTHRLVAIWCLTTLACTTSAPSSQTDSEEQSDASGDQTNSSGNASGRNEARNGSTPSIDNPGVLSEAVTASTGILVSSGNVVSVDTSLVPLLTAKNTFSEDNTFASGNNLFGGLSVINNASVQGNLQVEGTSRLLDVVDLNRKPVLGFVDSTLTHHPSFTNTTDSGSGTGTKGVIDGVLRLDVQQSGGTYEVRSGSNTLVMGEHLPGSYLTARVHVSSLDNVNDSVFVMSGGPTGAGNNSGGFGFKYSYNGSRVLEGVIYGANGILIRSVVLATGLSLYSQKLSAVHEGAHVAFYVDGVRKGIASTTSMETDTFPIYSVRIASSNGLHATVSHFTIGQP